jgi:hypothetical protein
MFTSPAGQRDQHIIENIEEAQDFATQWLWTYNNPSRALLRKYPAGQWTARIWASVA